MNKRRWERQSIAVPCTVSYIDEKSATARANIVNLSAGGVMLASDQSFIPNQRVTIALDDEQDCLLFELADILTGFVRWSQMTIEDGRNQYRVGIALERELKKRIKMTEQ